MDMREKAAMVRRVVRSYARDFAESGDEAELAELLELADAIDEAARSSVRALQERGWSWGRIGAAVGMTGDGARKRWSIDTIPAGPVVYGLRAAGTAEYRYVGQSLRLSLRVAGYRGSASTASRDLRAWLRGDGLGFEVDILERPKADDLDRAERRWIEHMRTEGHPLLNVLAGGRRTLPENSRCSSTEMRPRGTRRVAPREVRCALRSGHFGVCEIYGVPFGRSAAAVERAWARLEGYGVERKAS